MGDMERGVDAVSRTETLFAAAIVLASALGLITASRILEGPDKRRRQFFVYYTNLSNAVMLLTHGALLFPGPQRRILLSAPGRYITVLCILVTFVIYFFVLTRFGRHPGLHALGVRRFSNFLVHYLVPGLTAAEWLTAADKSGLGVKDALLWLLVPLAYLAFLLFRAGSGTVIVNTGSLWPYGFMDLEKLGVKKWLRNMAVTLAGFFVMGLALLGVSRLF